MDLTKSLRLRQGIRTTIVARNMRVISFFFLLGTLHMLSDVCQVKGMDEDIILIKLVYRNKKSTYISDFDPIISFR
jgi:hypothetical protein